MFNSLSQMVMTKHVAVYTISYMGPDQRIYGVGHSGKGNLHQIAEADFTSSLIKQGNF